MGEGKKERETMNRGPEWPQNPEEKRGRRGITHQQKKRKRGQNRNEDDALNII